MGGAPTEEGRVGRCTGSWSAYGWAVADRYGNDVLSGDWRKPKNGRTVDLVIEKGLVVEEPSSGYVGAVVRWEHGVVDLEDRFGKIKTYPLGPGLGGTAGAWPRSVSPLVLTYGCIPVTRPRWCATPAGSRGQRSGAALCAWNQLINVSVPCLR